MPVSSNGILLEPSEIPKIPLPKGWTNYTFLGILHVIALARIIILNAIKLELGI